MLTPESEKNIKNWIVNSTHELVKTAAHEKFSPDDWLETFWQKVFHKKVHHEWEETDNEHFRHYWRMVENTTIEVRNYLWKAGWEVSSHKQHEDSEANHCSKNTN